MSDSKSALDDAMRMFGNMLNDVTYYPNIEKAHVACVQAHVDLAALRARVAELEECLREILINRSAGSVALLDGDREAQDEAMYAFESALTRARFLLRGEQPNSAPGVKEGHG